MTEQLIEGIADILNPAFRFKLGATSTPPFWYGPKKKKYQTGDKVWFPDESGWHAAVVGNTHATVDIFTVIFDAVPTWSKLGGITPSYKAEATSSIVWPRTQNLIPPIGI